MKCQNCQKETKNPKFCSLSCSAKNRDSLPKKTKADYCCKVCKKIIQVGWTNRKYCEGCTKTHSKNYVDYTQVSLSDYFNNYSTHEVHAKIRDKARRILKSAGISSCQNCGYNKFIECCHIRPIHKFDRSSSIAEVNSLSNLVGLCPNCHWELDNGIIKWPR